ncbi:MAG: FIST signal transduction protein [Planctomycetota bacterium]
MRALTSHSDSPDTASAAAEILEKAMEQLAGDQPVCGFLFASTDYEHAQLLEALTSCWPDMPLVGGSTDGEMSCDGYFADSVVLTLLAGDGLQARVGLGRELSKDLEAAVADALEPCSQAPRLCWTVFAPSSNASAVVRGLQKGVGASVPIVGGLSGDHRQFSHMVQFCGSEVLTDALPVVYLDGDFEVGVGVGSGWFPIGPALQVTRSDNEWLHEIDGRPALEFYEGILGQVPAPHTLADLPLALFPDGPDGAFHLRAVFEANMESGSLRLVGEVREGEYVRLTEVLADGLLQGSRDSVQKALASYPGSRPELAFVFSCAARKWILGTQADGEVDLLREELEQGGAQPSIAGGYWFGEIAPAGQDPNSHFHNESCVTVLLGH